MFKFILVMLGLAISVVYTLQPQEEDFGKEYLTWGLKAPVNKQQARLMRDDTHDTAMLITIDDSVKYINPVVC